MRDVSLFIHSTGTGPSLWDGVPEEALAGSRKIAPANLGYPPDAPVPRGTYLGAAEDAAAVVRAVPEDAEAVHLYAHSYGCVVALAAVPLLGARARSLFLYEPVLFGALNADGEGEPHVDAATLAEARGMRERSWFVDDSERGGSDEWLGFFIDYWNRPGSWERLPEPLKAYARATGWKQFLEVRACLYGPPQRFDAVDFAGLPTTLVLGERTTLSARAMTLALSRRHPEARLVTLSGVGHMGLLTKPESVAPALIEHARRVRG